MRARMLHIAYGFAAAFVLLAIADARVQLMQRSFIESHAGDPRRSESIASRGTLYDARGVPLAESKGDRRVYPAGAALAQLVGYASPIYGESGLEAGLDSIVSPVQKQMPSIFGSLFAGKSSLREVVGGDVILTLRSDVAAAVDTELPNAIRGCAIVLDPRNGAILAIVNRPTFDPNRLEKDWKNLRDRSDAPLLDRGVAGLYPPGSTFKIVTVSAALDSGSVIPDDTFTDPGYFKVNGFSIHDNENEATGSQSVVGAFALSSNVDFAQIGVKLGADDFFGYIRRFGVGATTALAVTVERDEVPAQPDVSQSELAQMAFGQGSLAVTPLRMALVAAAIADGGIMINPQIVKQIRIGGRPPLTIPPAMGTQAVSAQTADEVKSMMEAVVRYGTGTAAALRHVAVAGKTGTATHPGGLPDAWFVCFAPADSPRLVVAVVVENSGYGGVVAAPIARRILAATLPLYSR